MPDESKGCGMRRSQCRILGFIHLLGEVCELFDRLCHGYCLMTNRYHLLIEMPEANLSRGMRQLNGVYTQRFSRRHWPLWSCVSGALQGHRDSEGSLPAGIVPVCGA